MQSPRNSNAHYSLRSTPPDDIYNLKIMMNVNNYNFVKKKLQFILTDDHSKKYDSVVISITLS